MSLILAIDTSCDETSAAVTDGRRVLSNVISSQIDLHKKYGGVYPALAKRAHEERIDFVISEAIRRASIVFHKSATLSDKSAKIFADYERICTDSLPITVVAVTQGPGLAIALEVGIKKAKNLSTDYQLPLIAINHLEGHIYSCLAVPSTMKQWSNETIKFPSLCLIVSGGHTELVLMKDHGKYEVIGETLDDACGEALDKAAKILRLGYPGGPIIERLAEENCSSGLQPALKSDKRALKCAKTIYSLSPPLLQKSNLNFSYSGLKTQFLYLVQKMSEEEFSQNLTKLAYIFQEACFEQITRKLSQAIKVYQPKTLLCGGGVIANKYLRRLLRQTAKKHNLPVLFPPKKNLITDNAAMIGVAAYYKLLKKEFVKDIESLEREPRMTLDSHRLRAPACR